MKADTIQDVELRGLLLKLESAFLTHQEVEELVDKVKRLEVKVEIARLDEREACAQLCDDAGHAHEVRQGSELAFDLAAAIRGRTE